MTRRGTDNKKDKGDVVVLFPRSLKADLCNILRYT